MANTFSASLVTDVARNTVMTILQAKLAMLNVFSKDFSTDELAPKKVVQVPKATAGATGQTNPSNYESGDSTLTNIAVTPNELSVSFHVTSAQLQQGYKLEQLFEINLRVLANMILDAAVTPVTTTNFATPLLVTAANFGTDDLTTLFGYAKEFNSKNLVLDGGHLANFIPTDKFQFVLGEQGAYGFDRIEMNNRWTAAGANVRGFVCDPQALAVASGLPIVADAVAALMLVDEVLTIPDLGISIRFHMWGSVASRAVWGSFGVMFGAAAGDTTAARLITIA
jgi:hypothetical protein